MDRKPFDLEAFFPRALFDRITDIRVQAPETVAERAAARRRPKAWVRDSGNVVILAADHPARGVNAAAGSPLAMGNRHSYLGRLIRVLASPWCDGILGTPDIIEDLFIVDHLLLDAGLPSLLDDRIVVGTMNRGGLAGAAFEMDDTFTAYTVERIVTSGVDAAKAMFRLDEADPAALRTLTACARAIDDCVDAGIPMYLEPLPVERTDTGYGVVKAREAMIRTVGIASGIGKSSLNTWIKIPWCEGFEDVARSTTCPILMLGGESTGDPGRVFNEFAAGMTAGANVRGALVGRNVHHPGTGDPAAVAAAVYGIVHDGDTAEGATRRMADEHLARVDALAGAL